MIKESRKKLVVIILVLSLLLLVAESIAFASTDWEEQPRPTIKSRSSWDARDPQDSMASRSTGYYLIFHHTGWKFSSTTLSTTINEIQEVQDYHMDTKGWSDIAYHYIIDPAGRIWRGRSDSYVGSHTLSYNHNIGIVVLGDFEGLWGVGANTLTTASYNAMCSLSKYLVYRDSLDLPAAYCHNDFNSDTECPGDNMENYVWDDLTGHLENYMVED